MVTCLAVPASTAPEMTNGAKPVLVVGESSTRADQAGTSQDIVCHVRITLSDDYIVLFPDQSYPPFAALFLISFVTKIPCVLERVCPLAGLHSLSFAVWTFSGPSDLVRSWNKTNELQKLRIISHR